MLTLLAALVLADPAAQAETGVICISPLPPAGHYGTAAKGVSEPDKYDDSQAAREQRVAQAKTRKPVIFSVGDVASTPVTDVQAACIDGIPIGEKHQLKSNGRPILSFSLSPGEPVRWLTFSAFYANDRLDPLPQRLYCKTRSPTPDCSWCPCKSRRYAPPVRAASKPAL